MPNKDNIDTIKICWPLKNRHPHRYSYWKVFFLCHSIFRFKMWLRHHAGNIHTDLSQHPGNKHTTIWQRHHLSSTHTALYLQMYQYSGFYIIFHSWSLIKDARTPTIPMHSPHTTLQKHHPKPTPPTHHPHPTPNESCMHVMHHFMHMHHDIHHVMHLVMHHIMPCYASCYTSCYA